MFTHKGYIGHMEIDEDEGVLYGRVINMSKDGITFSGKTVDEARENFIRAVEDYLAWAKEEGFEPEKPYGGKLILRTTPEFHKRMAIAAEQEKAKSLNQWVLSVLDERIAALQG